VRTSPSSRSTCAACSPGDSGIKAAAENMLKASVRLRVKLIAREAQAELERTLSDD
jgi:Fe-S cluster biogenesis protein NfuA